MEGLGALLDQLLGGVADWSREMGTGRAIPKPPPLSDAQSQLWRLLNNNDEQGVALLLAANPGADVNWIHPKDYWYFPAGCSYFRMLACTMPTAYFPGALLF